MKNLLKWLPCLLFAICSCAFIACSDDDDDKDNNATSSLDNTIWEYTEPDEDFVSRLTFHPDKTATMIEIDSYYEHDTETDIYSYLWKQSGTSVTLTSLEDKDENMVGTIVGTQLILKWQDDGEFYGIFQRIK